MQQGMEYMQQGIGYIQKIISSGKHTKVNLVQQGYRYDSEKRLWIEDIQRPPGSIFDMNKPHQGDEYENRQGISDIQRPSRSSFDMNKLQQGDVYEHRQGIADIRRPSRSIFDMSEPEYKNGQEIADIRRPSRSIFDMSEPEYENRQEITDIRRPSRSIFDMSEPQQGNEYENRQEIGYIQRPSQSISDMSIPQQGGEYENRKGIEHILGPARADPDISRIPKAYRYENLQGIEYVREKSRSETFYEQKEHGYKNEKPTEHIQIIVTSSSDDQQLIENISGRGRQGVHSEVDQNRQLMENKQALKRLAEHATEHVDQQGMGINDVKDFSVWFHDMLQAVKNEDRHGVPCISDKVQQYLDLHGIQNIRYRAQEELKLFNQQYDCIEKHPKAHDKFKELEVLLKICDAWDANLRREHLPDNTENRTQP